MAQAMTNGLGDTSALTSEPVDATRFGACLIERLQVSGVYTTQEFDVVGTREARQIGLLFIAARQMVDLAVKSFLLDHHTLVALSGQPTRLDLLGDVAGRDSEIFHAATALHTENPITESDVIDYVERCARFAREVAGLTPAAEMRDEKGEFLYFDLMRDAGALADHLGVRTPESVWWDPDSSNEQRLKDEIR